MVIRCITRGAIFVTPDERHLSGCLFCAISFLLLTASLTFATPASADLSNVSCPGVSNSNTTSEPIAVSRITDGDTLVLSDNRRVRLIGLNTLELNAQDPDDKRWAKAAARALNDAVGRQPVMLIEGRKNRDRYDRTLAHVLNAAGDNIASELIEDGLGLAVAIGSNVQCADYLLQNENQARQARRGIWQSPGNWFIDDAQLKGNERGFHLVESTVKQITGSKRSPSMLLNNGLLVKLGKNWAKTESTLNPPPLSELPGKRVEVRGWLSSSAGKVRLTLHHPANLRVLSH